MAPDKFAGTLTAPEAAAAIRTGWLRAYPDHELVCLPLSDGGPGFLDALHGSLGGEFRPVEVSGPHGARRSARILLTDDTAWVESAEAVGLEADVDAMSASSYGVGELIAAAVSAGRRRVVVGLGGTSVNDGGAGLLAALGAEADVALAAGPTALAAVGEVDLAAARDAVAGVELVAATDVEAPLTGMFGASRVFGPQKGLSEEQVIAADAALAAFAAVIGRKQATRSGAGAAGGCGYALQVLGARTQPGVDLVAEATGLAGHLAGADLAVTGEGSFDFSSQAGKVPRGVASYAAAALVPCIVLAGQVHMGSREMRAIGIEAGYSIADLVGLAAAGQHPQDSLAALAERVAGTWGRT